MKRTANKEEDFRHPAILENLESCPAPSEGIEFWCGAGGYSLLSLLGMTVLSLPAFFPILAVRSKVVEDEQTSEGSDT